MNRYFVSIDIPANVKEQLISYYYPLLKKTVEGRFIEENKLHITILFLGDTNINSSLIEFLKETRFSIDITLRGIGGFPSIENPKILYVPVFGDITPLRERLDMFLKIKDDKEFLPHVTICRVKKSIERAVPSGFYDKTFAFKADSLHLFNSDFRNYYKVC